MRGDGRGKGPSRIRAGGPLISPRGSGGLRDPAQGEAAWGQRGQTPACLRTDLGCQGDQ